MKKFIILLFYFIGIDLIAQTITPQVFNSAGGGGVIGSTGNEVYYNIGEPIVYTAVNSNTVLTQGFLQPDIVSSLDLSITPLFQSESCLNKNDGMISLQLNSTPSNAIQILYVWQPAFLCPSQTCTSVDSLAPGSYSVTVKALNSSNVAIDSISFSYDVIASTEPCQITTYNGFTPNGDGVNDTWLIDNIENFPDNSVTIFNRWGNQVWHTKKYDNTTNVWTGKTNAGADLVSGTYFFVIELDNGKGIKKGWVELTGK